MGLHVPSCSPDKVLDKSAEQNSWKILNIGMQPCQSIFKVSTTTVQQCTYCVTVSTVRHALDVAMKPIVASLYIHIC